MGVYGGRGGEGVPVALVRKCFSRSADLLQGPTAVHQTVQYVAVIMVMLAGGAEKRKLGVGGLLFAQDLLKLKAVGGRRRETAKLSEAKVSGVATAARAGRRQGRRGGWLWPPKNYPLRAT